MTKVACALSGNISTVLTNRFGADGGYHYYILNIFIIYINVIIDRVLLAHAIYSCYDMGTYHHHHHHHHH
jgi:hypothetical protein